MSIPVICPGCHARFKVSDKFAGKKGPCPKCKKVIRVPTLDERVVIHEPEHSEEGARNAEGQYVLKPIARKETRVQPVVAAGIVGASIIVVAVALALRSSRPSVWVLTFGAIALAPPLALGGYSFLRDDELEPYTGLGLAVRTAICAAVYAGTWGAYAYFYTLFFLDAPVETWNVLPFAVVFLVIGAGTAYVCYDLDGISATFHYSLYLVVTVVLRLLMGLPPV